jgi:SAM-dependent methyltransferase
MSHTAKEREFYLAALDRAKEGAASTGYGFPINQQVRFDTLKPYLSDSEVDGSFSILDVGCGTGDLIAQMNQWGFEEYEYLGVDPMPEMIATAKARYENANFQVGTVFDVLGTLARDAHTGSHDYVVSIAALAFAEPEWGMEQRLDFVFDNVEAMVEVARKRVFVTLFSTWKNHHLPQELNVDPATVFTWARQKWQRVELIHSYAPFDFALVVDKEEGDWWREWRAKHED